MPSNKLILTLEEELVLFSYAHHMRDAAKLQVGKEEASKRPKRGFVQLRQKRKTMSTTLRALHPHH